MFTALALAAAVGGAGVSTPVQQDDSVAGLVRSACIDTKMRREAFEALARHKRWPEARVTSRTSAVDGWNLHYRVGRMNVLLSGVPLEGPTDQAVGSVCTVTVQRPSDDWQAGVEAIAASLDLTPETGGDVFPGIVMKTWSKIGELTLSAASTASNQSLAVTLSRQIVTSTY